MHQARWVGALSLGMVLGLGEGQALAAPSDVFPPPGHCMPCHNRITTRSGEDISVGFAQRATMMANSARDPYWQAGVRREIVDHGAAAQAIENECSLCHMPMASTLARQAGGRGQVFAHLPFGRAESPLGPWAEEGVSCPLCHQIRGDGLAPQSRHPGGGGPSLSPRSPSDVMRPAPLPGASPDSHSKQSPVFGHAILEEEAKRVGAFVVDDAAAKGPRAAFGPFAVDRGRARVMESATGLTPVRGPHMTESELCATCHTLITHTLDKDGHEKPGTFLPEQVPYQEWQASEYAPTIGCPNCHMPQVEEPVFISSVLGQPHARVRRHTFLGGNFVVMGMLARHGGELSVVSLPQELELGSRRTREHLRNETARLGIEAASVVGGRLVADVTVTNLAGHKLPTAYPSRRVYLHCLVRDRRGRVLFESGAPRSARLSKAPENSFEPHHETITRPEEVQIYEAVMTDLDGRVTTGLLSAAQFVKDNRIPPRGFDKAKASPLVAVHGEAQNDPDFVGGSDRVRYDVDVAGAQGPLSIDVELFYEPISDVWARNLSAYRTEESARFSAYFAEMAPSTRTLLSTAHAEVLAADASPTGKKDAPSKPW